MPIDQTQDYYKILGVEPTATLADIKKAYIKAARKYHPDKFIPTEKTAEQNAKKKADNEEIFKVIQTAYEVLSDPERKAKYDNPLSAESKDQAYNPTNVKDFIYMVNKAAELGDIAELERYFSMSAEFKTGYSEELYPDIARIAINHNKYDVISWMLQKKFENRYFLDVMEEAAKGKKLWEYYSLLLDNGFSVDLSDGLLLRLAMEYDQKSFFPLYKKINEENLPVSNYRLLMFACKIPYMDPAIITSILTSHTNNMNHISYVDILKKSMDFFNDFNVFKTVLANTKLSPDEINELLKYHKKAHGFSDIEMALKDYRSKHFSYSIFSGYVELPPDQKNAASLSIAQYFINFFKKIASVFTPGARPVEVIDNANLGQKPSEELKFVIPEETKVRLQQYSTALPEILAKVFMQHDAYISNGISLAKQNNNKEELARFEAEKQKLEKRWSEIITVAQDPEKLIDKLENYIENATFRMQEPQTAKSYDFSKEKVNFTFRTTDIESLKNQANTIKANIDNFKPKL